MATKDTKKLAPAKTTLKNCLAFENEIRNKLKWTKKQWEEAGESKTRINKLCNSLNYWKKKLKCAVEERSLVLTLFNVEKDVRVMLIDLVREIENLDDKIKVQGFSDFRNPRYLAFYFKNKEERDYVLENFKMIENNHVVYLSWALQSVTEFSTVRVHWLPLTVDINIIKQELSKYVECIEEQRVSLVLMSGRDMLSGKVNFKVNFNRGIKAEDIPHLMVIADMEALITIPGRSPLCLNCDQLGHISRDCKLRFCEGCKKLQRKDHACNNSSGSLSYADVASMNVLRIDSDDWKAAITTTKIMSGGDKELISNKISLLEKQVNGVAEQIVELSSRERKVKRKLSGMSPTASDDSGEDNEEFNLMAAAFSSSRDSEVESPVECEESNVLTLARDMKTDCFDVSFGNAEKLQKRKDAKLSKLVLPSAESALAARAGDSLKTYGRSTRNSKIQQKENKAFDKLLENNNSSTFKFHD